MELNYYRKNVYGNEFMYILDPEVAKVVQTLTGRKTITHQDLNALSYFGVKPKEVIAPKESYAK